MAIQPNQPQGIGGVLDTAFQLYKESLGAVWPISLLIAVMSLLPGLYFLFIGMSALDPQAIASGNMSFFRNMVVVVLITVLPSMWGASAMLLKQRAIGSDESMSTGEAFRVALVRLLPLIGATIVYGVAITLGSILLIVPGLILMLSLIMYMALVVFDTKGPIDAVVGSHKLVWGNWWRTCAVFTVTAILLFVLFIAVGFVVAIITPFAGMAADSLVAGMVVQLVLNAVVNILISPFTSAVMIALYWDLKLRKEGGDLAARVDALSAA
ncbi:hypothetical protein ACFPN2_08850 [Steroidobacter flavus]|uniref:Glycerophosphoryl diester phosphodiesterase membrane domain-containing protein n=1 Tax=Steroidobacter flavus TaxID=1842136 RepID=A0ABV8SPD8_9GAMM